MLTTCLELTLGKYLDGLQEDTKQQNIPLRNEEILQTTASFFFLLLGHSVEEATLKLNMIKATVIDAFIITMYKMTICCRQLFPLKQLFTTCSAPHSRQTQ